METPTPASPVAQAKTLEEKIQAAKENERRLWVITETTNAALKPFQKAYNDACQEWCTANDRLKTLVAMKEELAQ